MLEAADRILCVRLRLFPAEFLSRSSTIRKIKSNPPADDQSTFSDSKAHKVIDDRIPTDSMIDHCLSCQKRQQKRDAIGCATKLVRLIMCPQYALPCFGLKLSAVVAARQSMTQRLIYLLVTYGRIQSNDCV